MGERGSEAAGGGRPLEERRTGVRTRVACRRRLGPSKSREEHQPGPSPVTSRTTAERAKDRAHWGFGQERHDAPGSAVGKDSFEAIQRTFEYVVAAGDMIPSNGV